MRRLALLLLAIVLVSAGCSGNGDADKKKTVSGPDIQIEFREAADTERAGFLRMNLSGTARHFFVSENVLLDARAVAAAEIDTTGRTSPAVMLYLTDEGREAFAEITRTHIGKRIGIIVDGLLLSAPLVMAEINTGRALIEGRFDEREAKRIVRHFNRP